jgi:hypothetical protein
VPSSGKSFLMNTVLTQLEPIMETQISNSKELTSITMKLLVEDTSQEQSLWTWNQVPWTPSELVHSVNSSDQTTSSSVNQEPVTTGLKVTIPRVLNLLIQFLTSLERKLKVAIAFKDSKLPTHSEEVLDQVWEPF